MKAPIVLRGGQREWGADFHQTAETLKPYIPYGDSRFTEVYYTQV